MRRKRAFSCIGHSRDFQKSLTTFWTLCILACLIAMAAMGVIVVPPVIQQGWPTATIAAYDIRFVDGRLYYCFEESLSAVSCWT
jgi:TRAP-type C4-dicarboxylate transport system permease small subunit